MGIREAVANKILQWATRSTITDALAEKIANAPVYSSGFEGQPAYSGWSTQRAIKEGYKASYIYYSAASDIADCIRAVPWYLKRKTTDGVEVVDDSPLAEMIRKPNPETTWGALCEQWDIYKSLDGNAYGRIVKEGHVVQVWSLRPDRVKIIPGANGHIEFYEYKASPSQSEKIPAEEILHFKFFDPGNDYYGLSPLQAAARIVDTSNAAVDWNKSSMANRAQPSGMFTPKTPLTSAQHKEWRDQIKAQLAGKANAHKILLNPFDAKFEAFELSPVEMDFIRSFETYEDAVCKVLHIHPEALGKSGATFENKKWAIRAKWEGPVTSRLREMRAVLNHRFGALFETSYPAREGGLYLDYDLSDTPAVLESRREASEEAKIYWSMGVPFNNIVQKLDLPFDPVPGGDVGYLPVNLLPAATAPAPARSVRAASEYADRWRAIDQRKTGWERGVASKIAGVFAEEGDIVAKAIRQGSTDVDYVIDGHRQAWVDTLTAIMRAVIEDFGGQLADDLNGRLYQPGRSALRAIARLTRDETPAPGYVFDPWSDSVQAWVSTKTAEHVTAVQEATKRAIRDEVQAGIDDGLSMDKIARKVRKTFRDWEGGTGVYRSMMIARTEVHTAAGFGQHESAKQSGIIEEKHWVDAGDDRVRDSHVAATAEGWIPIDQVHNNGCMYPGDGPAEEVIQCRCVEIYRTR